MYRCINTKTDTVRIIIGERNVGGECNDDENYKWANSANAMDTDGNGGGSGGDGIVGVEPIRSSSRTRNRFSFGEDVVHRQHLRQHS